MHDNNIDRTTDGKGMLREYSSDELRAFNLKGSKEKIPELEEVMQVVKGRCALLVEIKSDGKKNRGAEEKIIDLIRKYDAYGWCFIQSFHDKALERVHEADSNVVLFKTMLGKCPFMPVIIDKGFRFRSLAYYDYVAGFCVHRCLVTRSIVKKLHSSGRVLYAWTVNKDRNRVRLMKKGVNGVMTDYY
jgi:glycerophosphoryl diester phosphodiesterase